MPEKNELLDGVSMGETTLDGLRDIKVYQNLNGYRFSVDALLLYSFVNMKYAERIADLGAGSGIIGLLLARKYPEADIYLIELQETLCRLAEQNIKINCLEHHVEVINIDIKDIKKRFEPTTFDVVVSNPPFRKPTTGRLSIAVERAIARHEIAMQFSDLASSAAFLLKGKGRFFMIYHPERLIEVIDVLRANRLEPKRIRFVHNTTGTESKMVLIESVRDGHAGLKIEKPLYIYNEDGTYTEEMKEMYAY